jgi:hypothetical protein
MILAAPALSHEASRRTGKMQKLNEVEQAQEAIIRAQGAVSRAQGAIVRCRAALNRVRDITAASHAEHQMLQARSEEAITRTRILMAASALRQADQAEEADTWLMTGQD